MNNAIQDVNISARELCEKLTKELGPMKTEREHRINSIIIDMAQSLVENVPVFQRKYSLTGTFRANGDYQIIFPLGMNMKDAYSGLEWDANYEQYSFSFNTNSCDQIRMFLELLMVSFVFEPAQHKLIPQFYEYIKDFYNVFLAKEMTPTIKEYDYTAKWWASNSEEYDGTILKLVRNGDSWGNEG